MRFADHTKIRASDSITKYL